MKTYFVTVGKSSRVLRVLAANKRAARIAAGAMPLGGKLKVKFVAQPVSL